MTPAVEVMGMNAPRIASQKHVTFWPTDKLVSVPFASINQSDNVSVFHNPVA